MINIDSLVKNLTCIEGQWVIARPVKDSRLFERLKDAVQVFIGRADAVKYYKQ